MTASPQQHWVRTDDNRWNLPVYIHGHTTSDVVSNRRKSPLLLIQGWCGVAQDWGAIPKLLASRCQRDIITFDPRFMGQSTLNDDDNMEAMTTTTLHEMRNDVVSILNQLSSSVYRDEKQQASFAIGGASMGGLIAQLLVHSMRGDTENDTIESFIPIHDWNVSSVILLCTASIQRTKPWVNPSFLNVFDTWNQDQAQCANNFFSALGDTFLQRPGRLKVRDKLRQSFMESRETFVTDTTLGFQAQKDAIVSWSPLTHDRSKGSLLLQEHRSSVDGNVPPPSLIVHGNDDRVVPPECAVELEAELFNDAISPAFKERIMLRDCDHLLWITHGVELIEYMGSFFDEVDR